MKLIIDNTEYWIKDVEFPLNFDSMSDYEKWDYIYENKLLHREEGPAVIYPDGVKSWFLDGILVNGGIYKKIQNLSKEDLLVYMIDSEYKDYLPLIEYGLNQ